MADLLSSEQKQFFKQAFDQFDQDGDGRITSSELNEVLKASGANHTEEELQKMIAEVDSNKNGSIEFEEFLNMIANKFGSAKN